MLNETSQTQKERYYVILQVLEGRRGKREREEGREKKDKETESKTSKEKEPGLGEVEYIGKQSRTSMSVWRHESATATLYKCAHTATQFRYFCHKKVIM